MPSKKKNQTEERIRALETRLANANDALEVAMSLSPERDNNFFTGGLSGMYETRNHWDRKKVFAESLRAWRVNPIARRIVKLYTSFAIGKGLTIKSDNEQIQTFLTEWWNHPLNKFKRNVKRWKDEDTRTGNLFFLFNVQENGMSIIRAVPAEQVFEIETDEHDVEQETAYTKDEAGTEKWTADQTEKLFMVHYASNQPVGSPWGEADLSPLLVWIGRFSAWLENRARLNQFRTAFMYVVSGEYKSEGDRSTRQKELQANPPKPGSVLVMNRNNGEEWGILSANLDAFDASMDGTALKKMVLDGAGQPMHWHAEPEGATQTTAEAAGTPTFRTLEEMQDDFFETLIDMAKIAVEVKGLQLGESRIWIEGPDITERDNATLALALGRAYPHLAELYDREAIDAKEFMRLTYKMFAEVWDEKITPTIKRKPLIMPNQQQPAGIEDDKSDETDPKEDLSALAARFEQIARTPPKQDITINMPEQQAPVVNVDAPVNVAQPTINLTVPEQTAPVVNVTTPKQPAPVVNVTTQAQRRAAAPIVNVAAPVVNIKNDVQIPDTEETLVVERDEKDLVKKIRKTRKKSAE